MLVCASAKRDTSNTQIPLLNYQCLLGSTNVYSKKDFLFSLSFRNLWERNWVVEFVAYTMQAVDVKHFGP